MNSRDAIMKALTPDDMFNQKGLVWRSTSTLAQFASCDQEDVLVILDEHFQGLVSVKPNGKHPGNGPLVALNEHIHPDPPAMEPQVAAVAGNAIGAAIEGVAAAANGDVPAAFGVEQPIPVIVEHGHAVDDDLDEDVEEGHENPPEDVDNNGTL